MKTTLTELPVRHYQVVDAWNREVLLETRDYGKAEDALTHWEKERPDNEIVLVAILGNFPPITP